MNLAPGMRLGPYEILSPLGEGGMGQVWKARDTRLDRIVAIKTSHKKFSERFAQEARAIAALNHPHICTLYDVGPDYLVMEYVDGPEIKGPLPLDQTLKLAIQLASALEAAHKKSITHRDLKPANILTTKSGVKVLDFGLAKIERAQTAAANDETVTRALTQEGAIVGTLQYMAPEQLQAKVTDPRADIFSFGCVLYEMLTGNRAFDGANTASVIAAVLEREPPSVEGLAPASLDWLLKRCLAKDPDERWQTATDLRAALGRIEVIAAEASLDTRRQSRPLLPWAVAAVAIAAAATFAVIHYREKPPETRVSKLFLNPPEKTHFVDGPAPTVSPDGREIVFAAVSGDGKTQLWLRPLDSLTAQPLAGTENAAYPFWAPDSQSIAFFSEGKLRKLSLPGGSPVTLADVIDARGGSWSRNDVIVFAPSPWGGIVQVSASGGGVRAVIPPDSAHVRRFPAFLPDGKHFVFLESTTAANYFLRVASLDSSSPGTLLPDSVDSFAVYAQGNLLFLRGNTLVARPFDENKLAFTGNAVPLAERIEISGFTLNAAKFSASDEGLLVYLTEISERRMTWFDRSGKRLDSVGDSGDIGMVRFSPDRRTVAVTARDAGGNVDIWLYDIARGIRSRFTFDPARDMYPIWSPDGRTVIFRSDRNGIGNIFRKPADGSRNEEPLYSNDRIKDPMSISPDGKYLAFGEQGAKTGPDIWILPDPAGPIGASKPYPFLQTDFIETNPVFSPDGHWLAYQSNESGRNEVYVTPFPGPGGKRQISTAGGTVPQWRPDGKELFYSAAQQLMSAEVETKGADFEVKKVTRLFGPIPGAWDVSADGQRFLIAAPPEDYPGEPITVVRNWLSALKK